MKLVYFWVENFRNIERTGFSLSNRFKFNVKVETKVKTTLKITETTLKITVEISEKKNYTPLPEKFFNHENILSVHGIIGQNGSGKTSMLETLIDTHQDFEIFYNNEDNNEDVDNKKREFIINHYSKNELEIINNTNLNFSINKVKNKHLSENHKVVLYSNSLEGKKYEIYPKRKKKIKPINLTTDFLLRSLSSYSLSENKKKSVGYNVYNNFIIDEIKRQIWFTGNFKDEIPFDLPNALLLEFQFKLDIKGVLKPIKNFLKNNKVSLRDRIVLFSLIDIFYTNKYNSNSDKSHWERLLGYMFKIITSNDKYDKTTFKDKIFETLLNDYNLDRTILEKIDTLINILESVATYKVDINTPILKIDIKNNILLKLIEAYINIVEYRNGFISFHWEGLSAGENAYLSMFSRFSFLRISALYPSTYSNIQESESNLIFLFDEPESTFHPQWQRRFFSNILKILPILFPKNKMQIIISSHSPYICSDLPKSNILFLKKCEDTGKCKISGLKSHQETFAANIHDLLSSSFFMNSTIGEFAASKIKKIVEFHDKVMKNYKMITEQKALKEENQDKDILEEAKKEKQDLISKYEIAKNDWQFIYNHIGEDYIKSIIGNHLSDIERKLCPDSEDWLFETKAEKIQRLEKRIAELENAKNN